MMPRKRASHYLESLTTRAVAPATTEAIAALAQFEQPFPEGRRIGGGDGDRQELDEVGSPATMASAGGPLLRLRDRRGALPVTVAANWLSTAWDQ